MNSELLVDTEDLRAALVDGVVISHWRGHPSAETYRRLEEAERSAAQRLGTKVGALTTVDLDLSLKSVGSFRQRASSLENPAVELQKGRQEYLEANAVVFEETGFLASIMRSTLVGYQLVSRSRFPEKVFSQPADAARWLASQLTPLGTTVDTTKLVRALEALDQAPPSTT